MGRNMSGWSSSGNSPRGKVGTNRSLKLGMHMCLAGRACRRYKATRWLEGRRIGCRNWPLWTSETCPLDTKDTVLQRCMFLQDNLCTPVRSRLPRFLKDTAYIPPACCLQSEGRGSGCMQCRARRWCKCCHTGCMHWHQQTAGFCHWCIADRL